MTADLFSETKQARKQESYIFKILKGKKNCQPKFYAKEHCRKMNAKIKIFSKDIHKLKEFIASRSAW